MSDPPSYEDSTSQYGQGFSPEKTDSKGLQRFSIREEVGASRSQHVAAIVSRLLPHIRERALSGLSKTMLLLLPSDQDGRTRGQLVGFPEDELPIFIQLEGRRNSLQFWTQQEALGVLEEQMLAAISDDSTRLATTAALPERPSAPSKSSFFGRKSEKAVNAKPAAQSRQPPVSVEVQLDEAHFRLETEYGLFETARARAVLINVQVR